MDKETKYKLMGLKCGKELCDYHMKKHLEKEHQISIDWKGF